MPNIIRFLTDSRTVRHTIEKLDTIHFGKHEISLFHLINIYIQSFKKNEIYERSSGVAYNFTLALFPGVIFLITLIPYIPIPNLYENIINQIGDLAMFSQVTSTISDVINKPRGNLLSFSVVLSLYLSNNGMLSLMNAFNKIYKTVERRGFFKTRLISLLLTLLLIISIFIAVALLIGGQIVLDMLLEQNILDRDLLLFGIVSLRFFVIFIMFLLAISSIYYFAPALHRKWKFISPGSIVSTILIILLSYGFSYYITNFGTYNKLYGSIGAMIALMVWMFMISFILLSGFELNASLAKAERDQKKKLKES